MSNFDTHLEVDLNKVIHNYNIYKEISNKDVFAVVKANAYGLGSLALAKHYDSLNVPYLCTASLDEALYLRENNIKSPILVMGHIDSNRLYLALANNITISLTTLALAYEIKDLDIKNLKIHIKVNTRMNRLGLNDLTEVKEALSLLEGNEIEGIFTHYAKNDLKSLNEDFSKFQRLVEALDRDFKYIHASSSNSALIFKEDYTNACRIGIGKFGGIKSHGLQSTSSLYTKVISLREVSKGSSVGYDGRYESKDKEYVASIKIGYGDGFLRADTGLMVMINDRLYPVVGNVCMDIAMVLVDEHVKLYDKVEIFGDKNSIEELAKHRGSIVYEVLTLISSRVKRVYIK